MWAHHSLPWWRAGWRWSFFPFLFVLLLTQLAKLAQIPNFQRKSSFLIPWVTQSAARTSCMWVCCLLLSGCDSHKAPHRSVRSEDVQLPHQSQAGSSEPTVTGSVHRICPFYVGGRQRWPYPACINFITLGVFFQPRWRYFTAFTLSYQRKVLDLLSFEPGPAQAPVQEVDAFWHPFSNSFGSRQ